MFTVALQPHLLSFGEKLQNANFKFRIYFYDCHKQSRLTGESYD